MKKKKHKVRVRFLQKPLSQALPPIVRLVLTHYMAECTESGRCQYSLTLDELPMSLNHQKKRIMTPWMKNGQVMRESDGRVRLRPSEALKEGVHLFRAKVQREVDAKLAKWKPSGVTAAVILFESPIWLTQEYTVRQEDADNKLKPILDAIERATVVPDQLHWQLHAFKIASKKTRTIVYLFDLGDIVEYYS